MDRGSSMPKNDCLRKEGTSSPDGDASIDPEPDVASAEDESEDEDEKRRSRIVSSTESQLFCWGCRLSNTSHVVSSPRVEVVKERGGGFIIRTLMIRRSLSCCVDDSFKNVDTTIAVRILSILTGILLGPAVVRDNSIRKMGSFLRT